jgi:hypothetical protein
MPMVVAPPPPVERTPAPAPVAEAPAPAPAVVPAPVVVPAPPIPAPAPVAVPTHAHAAAQPHRVRNRHESAEAAASKRTVPEGPPGHLAVRVLPWAAVFVDGQLAGTTPFEPISVSPGHHSVRLVNDEIHAERTMTVEIKSGETATLKAKLE